MRGVVVSAAFDSGNEGLEYCLRTKPDLLAVDLFLPDIHGSDNSVGPEWENALGTCMA